MNQSILKYVLFQGCSQLLAQGKLVDSPLNHPNVSVCQFAHMLVPPYIFSRPGWSQGLLYKHIRHWFFHSFINWSFSLPQLYGAATPKGLEICLPVIKKSLRHSDQELSKSEGHQNPISGSKVTAVLLKGRILSIGGVASGRVCACSLRSRLV